MDNCSTTGGRSIHTFSNFDLDFVTVNDVFSNSFEIVQSAHVSKRSLASITVRRCEPRKLYESVARGAWARIFEMTKISEKVDAGEGLKHLNPPKSLAGAISMPCGAPRFHSHDS